MVHVVFVVLSSNTEKRAAESRTLAVSGWRLLCWRLHKLAGLARSRSLRETKWLAGRQACRRLLRCLTSERRQRFMLRGIPGVLANERRRQARPPCWPRPLAAGMCQGIALPVIGRPRGSVGFAVKHIHFPTFSALATRHPRPFARTCSSLERSSSSDQLCGCSHPSRNRSWPKSCPTAALRSKQKLRVAQGKMPQEPRGNDV